MSSIAEQVTLEALDDDPYEIYRELRRHEPVAWLPELGVWFVTRWDDCSRVATDRDNWVGAANHPTLERVFGAPNVLTADGEVHVDQRKGIGASLTPRAVLDYIDDLARPLAIDILADVGNRGCGDLMSTYFEPVGVRAFGRLLGLDEVADADTLRRWFYDLNSGVSNVGGDESEYAAADAASAEIEEAIGPLLTEVRASPDHSMLSHMIHFGRENGSPRTDAEVFPSLKVLLLGGMQEPAHGAGSTLLGLFSRPEQLRRVVDDPALIPAAVTEGLRWIAPIGAVERQARGPQRIGDVEIADGEQVELMVASANRDEHRYDDPDLFDLNRPSTAHLAFGGGAHFCSGHFFSRHLERIMLEELLARLPDVGLADDDSPLVTGWFFRGPKRLPAVWTAPPAG